MTGLDGRSGAGDDRAGDDRDGDDGVGRDGPDLVSVCVPAYRAEATLGATIESVLAQTHTHWELVVVDDHSDDATVDVARSFDDPRIRVVAKPATLGLGANFERAVEETRADYVKLLCADDLIHPTCLADQLAVLRAEPDVVLTAARRDIVDGAGAVVRAGRGVPGPLVGRVEGAAVVRHVVGSGHNPIGEPASVLFRRTAKDKAGAFSQRYQGPTDLDMWIRILRSGDFYGDTRTLASFRVHGRSLTASTWRRYSHQDRTLFRAVAADPYWAIGRRTLWEGLARSVAHNGYRWYRARRVLSRP